jgi:hypothetical protein
VRVAYSTLNYKDGLCLTGGGGLVRNYPHVLTGAGVKLKPVGDAEMVFRSFSRLVNDWPIEN